MPTRNYKALPLLPWHVHLSLCDLQCIDCVVNILVDVSICFLGSQSPHLKAAYVLSCWARDHVTAERIWVLEVDILGPESEPFWFLASRPWVKYFLLSLNFPVYKMRINKNASHRLLWGQKMGWCMWSHLHSASYTLDDLGPHKKGRHQQHMDTRQGWPYFWWVDLSTSDRKETFWVWSLGCPLPIGTGHPWPSCWDQSGMPLPLF